MELVTVALDPGQALAHVGVLVTCEGDGGVVARGLRVRASGDAVERGVVSLERARARPWSARLAPWEASGWEHALESDGAGGVACALRGARAVGADGAAKGVGWDGRRAREALVRAVWVELVGRAGEAGEGDLEVRVAAMDGAQGEASARVRVRVRERARAEVLTAYGAWDGTLAEHAQRVRGVMDAFARRVAGLPRGPRVVVARGTAPDRLYLRDGCAVMGEDGLAGDARFRELARRMRAGALERLVLAPPGACARDAALEVTVAHAARYGAAPVEIALSVGRALVPDERAEWMAGALRGILEQAGAARSAVSEHAWAASLFDRAREGAERA